MNLDQEIKQIYNSRNSSEQACIDIFIDILGLIDPKKIKTGENHTFLKNNSILEIALQHKTEADRYVLFLFQSDFLEIHINSYIETFYFYNLVDNTEKKRKFRNLIFSILDSSYKYVEYYLKNELIKLTTVWDENFIPESTVYAKPFGRLKEKIQRKRKYQIKVSRAESFLDENKKREHIVNK